MSKNTSQPLTTADIYEPQEDSYLLAKSVKKLARGRVLDMGTGSGIQAETAARKKNVKSVLAVDVNKTALELLRKKTIPNITIIGSFLFERLPLTTFDTILFNPPYLPDDSPVHHLDLEGGVHGYELILKFLIEAGPYLAPNGRILLLISSHSKPKRVEKFLEQHLYEWKIIDSERMFFEELFIYDIKKSNVRKRIESQGIILGSYLASGHRGSVIRGQLNDKQIVVKTALAKSTAVGRIHNESRFLRILNKKTIGPPLVLYKPGFIVQEFIAGPVIRDWLDHAPATEIKLILAKILDQCFAMDALGINKLEMHRPHKHIILSKKGPVLIDFERCYYTCDPKNVSQFCQYMLNRQELLAAKGIYFDRSQLIAVIRSYKNDWSNASLRALKHLLTL